MPVKQNLPPRLYFTLEQASKELDCDKDYLIHLGATGRTTLMIRRSSALIKPTHKSTDDFKLPDNNDSFHIFTIDTDEDDIDGYYIFDAFLIIDQVSLIILEAGNDPNKNDSALSVFEEAWFFSEQGEAIYKSAIAGLKSENPGIERFSIHPVNFEKNKREKITLENETLYITREALEKIRLGKTHDVAHNNDAHRPPIGSDMHLLGAKGRNSYLRTIEALTQALIKDRQLALPTKAAEAALAALAQEGIEAPVESKALSQYLKEAKEIRKKK